MQWASTLKMSNDRSPDTGMRMATVVLKSIGKCAGKSGETDSPLEPTFSPVNTNCKKKKKEKKNRKVFKNGRRQRQSQEHCLHLCLAYHRLTHLTHLE